jgi:hypothetical protein
VLPAEYQEAFDAATEADLRYLEALNAREDWTRLADLAMDARDLWARVGTLCALGEDLALIRIGEVPWRHRQQALRDAWLDVRNWAVRGEDASARCQMAGALIKAHLGEPPGQATRKLRGLPSGD